MEKDRWGTKSRKTKEDLIEASQKAWENETLVKIVQNAPTKDDGTVNFKRAYILAFYYMKYVTGDIKTAKESAVVARWLARLKSYFPDEFLRELEKHKTISLPSSRE